MSGRLPQLLSAHVFHIKSEWVSRLRGKPARTALGHADMLIHRMDVTLLELHAILRQPRATRPPGANAGPPWNLTAGCGCGLNPLLDFFVTGDEALRDVLTELSEAHQAELNRAWHFIAQSEIESLCSTCCRTREACPLKSPGKVQTDSASMRRR